METDSVGPKGAFHGKIRSQKVIRWQVQEDSVEALAIQFLGTREIESKEHFDKR